MPPPPQPPLQDRGPSPWKDQRRMGAVTSFSRLLLLTAIVLLLALPFTPFAGKIKRGLKELIEAATHGRVEYVTQEVEVTREVEKDREVIKEVIKEVQVPAPPPPLPSDYIPRKDVDVAKLYNGIQIKTNLITEQGTFASLERLDPEAYRAEFQLSIRVPKANQSVAELSRINPQLPSMLPDLEAMLETGKVSGFYHKLYENKTNSIQRDITRLNRVLDRHNFFDCETILELQHPTSKRRSLLIQSEMDVVADGSDGDRMPTLDEYIYMSDYYQPFTSYGWAKRTKTPNPLLSRWESRLKKAKEEFAVKGLSAARNQELRALISQLEIEIREMKSRSSLIAEKDPFVVISLLFRPYADQNPHTPKIGDYAVVIHEGKMYPAICGDYGPSFKMGEASLFIAKAVNENSTPYRRPESDLKVTYLIFPGTAEKPFGPPNLDRWHEQCSAYLKEIGGLGGNYSLHRWEDPFKKPEPAVLGGVAGATPTVGAGAAATATPAATSAPSAPGAASATPATAADPATPAMPPATPGQGAPAAAPTAAPVPGATSAPGTSATATGPGTQTAAPAIPPTAPNVHPAGSSNTTAPADGAATPSNTNQPAAGTESIPPVTPSSGAAK